jgi:Flp pilus assembly protein TadG
LPINLSKARDMPMNPVACLADIPWQGDKRLKALKEESGQTLVVVAAFMGLVALGFLAFAIDVGSLFSAKRMAQGAANAAALAAAEEMASGNSSNEQSVANAIAKLNGFDTTLATNPATVTLLTPASGNFVGASYVQAAVSKPTKTIFLGAFASSKATMAVSAQAIAGATQSQTCVCLGGTSGQALNMSNGSTLNATGCGIVDNSSSSNAIGIVGGSTLNALTLGTVSSNWDNASNINNGGSISSSTTIVQGITSSCSPTMPAAPSYSGCVKDPGGSYGTYTWGPASASGVVCYKALTVGANGATVTLKPGTYVITTGSLHFESGSGGHSNLGGNGVFFYLTGTASLLIDNGANVNLTAGGATQAGGGTAPTVGIYNGIAVYQATGDAAAMSIQGGSSTYLNGALYAPSAAITVGNGSGAVLDAGIAAKSLTINGGGAVNAVADTNEGSLALGSAKLVQ